MELTNSTTLNVFFMMSTVAVPFVTAKSAMDRYFFNFFVSNEKRWLSTILTFFAIEVPMFLIAYQLRMELLTFFSDISIIKNSFQYYGLFCSWQFFIAFSFLPRTRTLLIQDLYNNVPVNFHGAILKLGELIVIGFFFLPLIACFVYEYLF